MPTAAKEPKRRRGTAQDGHFVSIFALPPVPHYGGRVPVRLSKISGAQNLSGDLRFLPGHWALASPKFQSVRFLFRAWLYRANAPGRYAVGPVWDRPLREKGAASISAVGAAISRLQAFPLQGGRLPLSRGDVERSETKGIGICPSRGPASVRPLRKRRNCFQVRRRGGPMWPPVGRPVSGPYEI